MPRKLILDVDTGTDDAVAIMLAALHPGLDLIACTTVNGNAEVEHCTDNTLRVLDHIGRSDIPVYQGLRRPLVREDFPIPRNQEDQQHGCGDTDDERHVETGPVPVPEAALEAGLLLGRLWSFSLLLGHAEEPNAPAPSAKTAPAPWPPSRARPCRRAAAAPPRAAATGPPRPRARARPGCRRGGPPGSGRGRSSRP